MLSQCFQTKKGLQTLFLSCGRCLTHMWYLPECPQEDSLGKALWEGLATHFPGWWTTYSLRRKQGCATILTPLFYKGNMSGGTSLLPIEFCGPYLSHRTVWGQHDSIPDDYSKSQDRQCGNPHTQSARSQALTGEVPETWVALLGECWPLCSAQIIKCVPTNLWLSLSKPNE